MKPKILFLFVTLFALSCSVQKYMAIIPPEQIYSIKDGKIHYEEVVPVDNTSADELFFRAKLLVADRYVSSSDVTKLEDKENGLIIVKALFIIAHNQFVNNGRISYTLKLETKDNRYKYTITDLRYKFNIRYEHINRDYDEDLIQWGLPTDGYESKYHNENMVSFSKDVNSRIEKFINLIKKDMSIPHKSDW